MKTRHTLLLCLLWSMLAAHPAWAVRDPFWPLGYTPANEAAVAPSPAAQAEPPRPEPPREKPISEEDWAKARKALVISGITKTVRPDTHETRILAMINRQMLALGDTVTFIHLDVRYQWLVETLSEKEVGLKALLAERVVPKPNDLKQPSKD